jgi:hypothetical protein
MLHVIEKKIVAAHNKRAKISPSTSVLFATRARILRVFASELIFTFLYAGISIQNTSEQFVWFIRLSPVNFALHQTPQTKIITELGLEIQVALSR